MCEKRGKTLLRHNESPPSSFAQRDSLNEDTGGPPPPPPPPPSPHLTPLGEEGERMEGGKKDGERAEKISFFSCLPPPSPLVTAAASPRILDGERKKSEKLRQKVEQF